MSDRRCGHKAVGVASKRQFRRMDGSIFDRALSVPSVNNKKKQNRIIIANYIAKVHGPLLVNIHVYAKFYPNTVDSRYLEFKGPL